ncbi:MAG: antibiotic biosynthesis monooxygenase family protein [Pseudomonadota bacterium]
MALKVIVRRIIPQEKVEQLLPLIDQLRRMARTQSGYIYGETLRSAENPEEYLVVSNWHTLEHWKAWECSAHRCRLLERIEMVLGSDSEYRLYHHEFLFAPMVAAISA